MSVSLRLDFQITEARMKTATLIAVWCFLVGCNLAAAHRFGYSAAEQRLWKRKHQVNQSSAVDYPPQHSLFLSRLLQKKHCSGPHQSPVAIHSRRSIPGYMPAIEFVYFHNLLMGPLKIHNNGHSVSLIVPKPGNYSEFPYIFGGKLRAEFEFVGLHFHWGDKNNRGAVSECCDILCGVRLC